MQLLPQLLQQAGGALALLVVFRQLEIARQGPARGQQVVKPEVEDGARAPQLRLRRPAKKILCDRFSTPAAQSNCIVLYSIETRNDVIQP